MITLFRYRLSAVAALAFGSAMAAVALVRSGLLDSVRTFLAQHLSWQLDEVLAVLLVPIVTIAFLSSLARDRLRRASARNLAERDEARRLALCDPLTGLLNRRGLNQALADLPPAPYRVFLIDIDGFKAVNDNHGHAVGDAILRQLAGRLQELVHEHGVIAARLGGDEMALVAQSRGPFSQALDDALSSPLRYGPGASLSATVSIGTAELGGGSFLGALERADEAMYEAKRRRSLRVGAVDTTRMFETQLRNLPETAEGFCIFAVGINRAGDGGRPLSYGQAGPLTRVVREALTSAFPQLPTERLSNDVLGIAAPVSMRQEVTAALAELDVTCELDGLVHRAKVTVGRAGPRSRLELRDAVEQAQLALDNARRSQRPVADFDDADRVALRASVELLRDLREAIASEALELHYQPKLNLRTNTIDSVEALVRWTHPELGAVSPGHFIPLAEDSGDIRAVTKWVFGAACRASAKLQEQNLEQPIYVNVSAMLIAEEAFVADLIAEASATGARLGIEVTETACLEQPERALANLERLTRAGLCIAIDDYGVGLSSLTYLRQMPASELKIDMSFIRDLSESHRDPLIVRSTIDLAHALDLKVTAEGVDKPEILALLRVMGCDYVQGFEIAPALKLSECIDMLKAGIKHEPQIPDFAAELRRFINPVAVRA